MAYPRPILYSYGEPVGIYSPNYENFGMTFYEMMEETVQAGNIAFAHELPDLYPVDNPESQIESYVWNDVPMGNMPSFGNIRGRGSESNQDSVPKASMIDFMEDIPPGGRVAVCPSQVMPVQIVENYRNQNFRNENFYNTQPLKENINEANEPIEIITESLFPVEEVQVDQVSTSPYPEEEGYASASIEVAPHQIEVETIKIQPTKRKNVGSKKKLVEQSKPDESSSAYGQMNAIPERSSLEKGSHRPRKRTMKVDNKGFPKPAYSYSCLIALALKNSVRGSLSVSEIYKFMCEHFPFFNTAPSGWKNSVRHNLSLNKCFVKIMKPTSNPNQRKGCLWTMNPAKISKMDEEIAKWSKKDPLGIRKGMHKPENLELIERGDLVRDYSYNGNKGNRNEDEDDDDDSQRANLCVAVNVPEPQMIFKEEPAVSPPQIDFPNYETPPESLIDDFDLAALEKILNGEGDSPGLFDEDYQMIENMVQAEGIRLEEQNTPDNEIEMLEDSSITF